MTKILPKPKNDQNTLEIQKLPKYPQNLKMTKIPPQTPKKTEMPSKLKKYQIPLKPKK